MIRSFLLLVLFALVATAEPVLVTFDPNGGLGAESCRIVDGDGPICASYIQNLYRSDSTANFRALSGITLSGHVFTANCNNSKGKNNLFCNFFSLPLASGLKAGATCTYVLEVLSHSGDPVTFDTGNTWWDDYSSQLSYSRTIVDHAGVYVMTKIVVAETANLLERAFLYVPPGASSVVKFRISIFEGSLEIGDDFVYGPQVGYLPIPWKTGFRFDGWFDESGNLVTDDTVLGNRTEVKLTAAWSWPKLPNPAYSVAELQKVGLPLLVIDTVNGEEPMHDIVYPPPNCVGVGIANATKVKAAMEMFIGTNLVYSSGPYNKKSATGLTVKIRGNTSAADSGKKPYKLKLNTPADLLLSDDGVDRAERNWVLLRVGERLKVMVGLKINELVGLDWTPHSRFVNVVMNDDYRGLYYLCESVERNPDCRIDVDEDGIVIENDAYWWNEEFYFKTQRCVTSVGYTFKYPDEPSDVDIAFASNEMERVERSIADGNYQDCIDVVTWARWLLGHDILGNFDSAGSNIFLSKYDSSDNSKVRMPTMWDFDAIFLKAGDWAQQHFDSMYYPRLIGSTNRLFNATYCHEWKMVRDSICAEINKMFAEFVDSGEAAAVDASRLLEHKRWSGRLSSTASEIADIKAWFTNRVTWIEANLGAFPVGDYVLPAELVNVKRPKIGSAISLDGGQYKDATITWYRGNGTDRNYGSVLAEGLSYIPTVDDCEHWLKVIAAFPSGQRYAQEFYFSRLPVCYIDVENGATPSPQKEDHAANIRIQGNMAYSQQYDGAATIHVRGNNTATHPKLSWKLKLDKKSDIFGMGNGTKNKHWVLLANYLDECMMRNTIGCRLSAALGLVNMKTEWVDVVLNGQYNGCYQLSQHIRVGADRVPIYDWEDASENAEDLSWVTSDKHDISGGYLWEMSAEMVQPSQFEIVSANATVPTIVSRPEYLCTNPEMMEYCRDLWQRYWDACTSSNGYNSVGEHYSDLCDVDSMVAYWLTMVTMENTDSKWKSRFAYKERGEKIKFGPVWDFDWGCGSPIMLTDDPTSGWRWSGDTNSLAVAKSENQANFFKEWGDDPWFCQKAYEQYWAVVHPYFSELISEGGTFDKYAALLAEAGIANERKWKFRVGFSGPDGDVARYRKFLSDRLAFLDDVFKSVSSLMAAIRVGGSSAPYARSTSTVMSVKTGLGEATVDADSSETEVPDLHVYHGQDVQVVVTASTGSRVALYVDGLLVARSELVQGAASLTVHRSSLKNGKKCVLAVNVESNEGAVLKRTFVLVSPAKDMKVHKTSKNGVGYSWLADLLPDLAANGTHEDFELAAEQMPSPLGKSLPLSYDWIVGTSPTNEEDVLTVEIEMQDGQPKVTWKPDCGDTREYVVKGAESLDGDFVAPIKSEHRFYKVEVSLP